MNMRIIELPNGLRFPMSQVASFDVDPQNGFTPLCPTELPVPEGDQIVDELNAQARLTRLRVGSGDFHPLNALWETSDPTKIGSPLASKLPYVDKYWSRHCVDGTFGAQLLAGLPKPEAYDFFVRKGMLPDMHPYGALFHDPSEMLSTGVAEYLKANGIEVILVGGLAEETYLCVGTNVRQLLKAGFHVVLNRGATRLLFPNKEQEILDEYRRWGVTLARNAAEIESWIRN